ncbi:tol-pal system protein YbgF [Pleionea sp. CnH1-48]|uniref:tol-pal system protein YbgF n=1 Tax=Pleionea sp. CnH1-48 TaxID=2954494 RepID=UPI0020976AFB|nr:tol-pal system protein YbgF [Pleionea sp. CnH1-48]MCO7224775.1 tol-pal system protein YbgF [Pleionea sp. CnH1-48]
MTSILTKTALVSVLSAFSVTGFSAESVEDRVRRLEQMAESRGQLQADLVFQLNSLQQEVQQLRGMIEEHDFKLKQLQERQRDLYRDIERRLSKISSTDNNTSVQPDTMASTNSGRNASNQTSSTPKSVVASGDEHAEYQTIFPMVRARKYDEAITLYKAFLKKYPSGKYTANAHYWLGQVYFVKNQVSNAQKQFETVINQFSNSSKVSDAMLKLAQLHEKQGQWKKARDMFQSVIDKFDGTSEQLATQGLQRLKKAGH